LSSLVNAGAKLQKDCRGVVEKTALFELHCDFKSRDGALMTHLFLMGKFVEINQTGYLCGVNQRLLT
jgi:hypothetical protein